MFLSRKHLSRRTMLRGMGVSLGLPFLESMMPAQTPIRKTAASPRTRLACIEMVHGAAGSTGEGSEKHYWAPAKTGRDFEFTQSLEPLAHLRDYITVVSDTDLHPATAWSAADQEVRPTKLSINKENNRCSSAENISRAARCCGAWA